MELALITIRQVFVLFILIGVGYIASKSGAIKAEARQHLSSLLVYVVVPCMILNSYFSRFDPTVFRGIVLSFIHSFILIMIGLVLAMLLTGNMDKKNRPILRFALVFSNAGYMGFPLIESLFGAEGLLYASSYNTVFNIMIWTFGYAMVSGHIKPKEILHTVLTTPAIIAVPVGLTIYLTGFSVPAILQQPISLIGAMNTPISMIITGMIIASSDLKKLIKNINILKVVGIRLILIPACCILIYGLLHIDFGMASDVVMLLEACPCAAITSVFAIQFHYDEDLAAGSVVLSTLFSIVTLSIVAYVITSVI